MTKVNNSQPVDYPQVVVTGADGWLGIGLLAALQSTPAPLGNSKIRALVLPTAVAAMRERYPHLEILGLDLRDPTSCQQALDDCAGALVIHTAGVIHPRWVREFWEVNAQGANNLATAALTAKIRRIVAVSSNSPCGFNPTRDHRFTHDEQPRPYLNYGRSKLALEKTILALGEQGIECVVARAPWFYGPHQPERQNLFFRMVRDGKAPIVGDGENLRSMSYIANLAAGLLLASTDPGASGIYWFADAEPYTTNMIVATIESLLEEEFNIPCQHKRLVLPNLAATTARTLDAMLQTIGLYHQKIHVLGEMNQHITCSIQRAQDELGYEPRVSLREGMHASIEYRLRAKGQL